MIWGNKMIELGVAALLGAIIGGLATFGVIESSKQPAPIVVSDQVAKSQVDVQKQLTDLDIIDPICSSDYIRENSDLLCRELTCLMFTRGIDSETSGSTCESISNISNKIQIEKWCNQYQDEAFKEDCINLFWKRN
tara:strand:- start:933 stop:1340 length:408 start_codon:yes stop_codon:yes gene_type:complete